MNCAVCAAEDIGETRPDSDSIIHILGLLTIEPTMLERILGGLCEAHRRRVDEMAEAARQLFPAEQKGLS